MPCNCLNLKLIGKIESDPIYSIPSGHELLCGWALVYAACGGLTFELSAMPVEVRSSEGLVRVRCQWRRDRHLLDWKGRHAWLLWQTASMLCPSGPMTNAP
jgi:hypothetical protein